MVRAWLAPAIAAFLVVGASCGGDAFTAGGGATDGGGGRDALSDGAPPADANGEPPPSCMGNYACVPAVPSGWDGPLEVYSGISGAPACTTGFAQSIGAYDGLQAAAPTCGCSCGPTAITCAPPNILFYDAVTCGTGASCASEILQPGACTTVNEMGKCLAATGGLAITPVAGTSTMGPCAPKPTRDVPAYTWSIQARGCLSTIAPAQLDCAAGQTCAPKPEPGFAPKLCIDRPGDWSCPGGGYGVKHLFYTSVTDTRDCTACTCAPPNGGSCSFSITESSSADGTCTGGTVTYIPGDKCAGITQPGDFRLTMTPTAGTCGAGNSTATGSATPGGPVTVCCPL
jgi:hypothetical protein